MSLSPKATGGRASGYLSCQRSNRDGGDSAVSRPYRFRKGHCRGGRTSKSPNPSSGDPGRWRMLKRQVKIRRASPPALGLRAEKGTSPLRARPRPFLAGSEFQGGGAGPGRRRDAASSGGACVRRRGPAPAPPGQCSPGRRGEPGERGDPEDPCPGCPEVGRAARGLRFPGLCDLDWPRTLSGPGREHCGGSRGPFGVRAFLAPAGGRFSQKAGPA